MFFHLFSIKFFEVFQLKTDFLQSLIIYGMATSHIKPEILVVLVMHTFQLTFKIGLYEG